MQKIAASELRKAIAQGHDDPIFKAMWVEDGEDQSALVRATSTVHARNLIRAMLSIDPDRIRQLTIAEMADDSIINDNAARNIELNGYHLYHEFA